MWGDVTSNAVLEARSYVYTWVTGYGEESAPSPPTVVTGWSNATWEIDLFTPPPDDMGVLRNIITKRIYRSISGNTGVTSYFLVTPPLGVNAATCATLAGAAAAAAAVKASQVPSFAGNALVPVANSFDIPIAQAAFFDVVDDATIAFNAALTSILWTPPPENLQGILSMPNGMAVGFKGNEVWFCEPYHPHAWPSIYTITTEFPIVGIGVIGQSAVICTSGTPYVATGTHPAQMSLQKTLYPAPCASRGSILSADQGVYYSAQNGLMLVKADGSVTNTTELWITRDKWNTLAPQKNLRVIMLASCYFAFGTVNGADHSVAQKGFTIELAGGDSASFTIWPQPGGHRLGLTQLTAPGGFDIYNVQVDPWTGTGLLIQNGGVYYYDFTDQTPTMMPYKWRTKVYEQTSKQNYEAMRIFFTVPAGTSQNGTRNVNDPQPTLASDQYGIVRVYGDGNLVTTREIRNSGELLRILSGFKYTEWQWEFEARVIISIAKVATSVRELGSI
jgi:hypothetical protein